MCIALKLKQNGPQELQLAQLRSFTCMISMEAAHGLVANGPGHMISMEAAHLSSKIDQVT